MSFVIYLLQISCYSLLMWAIYCVALRRRPLHRWSRIYLLLCAVLPIILPLIHCSLGSRSVVELYRIALPEVLVATGADQANTLPAGSGIRMALWMYAAIAAGIAGMYIAAYTKIHRCLRKGSEEKAPGYRIVTGTGIGPGTIGTRIFFPGSRGDDAILRHELAHIRAGHRYDAALLQLLHVVFWASPAVWIIGRELKMVHEFEADAAATQDAEIAPYAALLLGEAFGLRAINIAHSFFHHPLKRRINMLQKSVRRRNAISAISVTAVFTTVFVTAALFAQTKHRPAAGQSQKSKDSIALMRHMESYIKKYPPAVGAHAVQPDGRVVYKFVEQMPEFNGDLSAYLGTHLHYPDSARAHGEQGRSIVQFVVDEQGNPQTPEIIRSSGYPLLDAEALRAISSMPAWKPGTQGGQAVSVYFTMPVTFKLN